ncbi:pentatricopeptide repeat-containing protein At3g29230-like [Cornus florida]|uniref:pentatricopeptide repeat-containing protein At3g29230-like n=1 Tax=Cornus florida TaxID=4283 RepID=UPI00289B8E7F|nr:pentatricopeptide repeat-containing protein At3g29230-like [Cornus florida]
MSVRLKSSRVRLSSQSLQKLIETQKNLPKSSPKLWTDPVNNELAEADDNRGVRTLTLSHPILRILESCNGTLKEFNQVHAQLIVSGLFQHPLASSRVVKKLCSSPSMVPHAVALFDLLEEPDAFICNTIMRSYIIMNDPHRALTFFYHQMIGKCVAPNHYTYPLLVKVCSELGLVREGEKSHARVVKFGFELDLYVRNSLIHFYSVCGRIEDACEVFDLSSESDLVTWNSMISGFVKNGEVGVARGLFDVMPERDVFSWNSIIAGYVGIEDMEEAKNLLEKMPYKDVVSCNYLIDWYARVRNVAAAREVFDWMPLRNVVSWNTMLALYVRSKDYSECLRLFDRMMEGGDAKPTEATFTSVLSACAHLKRLDVGEWVHSYIQNNRNIELDVLLSTSLLTMYAKCGAMDLARDVFDKMPERSVVSWNSIIMGYGMRGHGDKALEMFLEMEKRGIMPNDATFVCLLSACTHAGMVLEGWWHFDRMCRVYKIEPKVEHFGCMVDLLGQAGLMKDSEKLIRKVPMKAGPALWGALLSACRTHSNLELGEVVAKRLIELKPGDIGPYVLLSNIYAAEGRWDDVEKVRKIMMKNELGKVAGSSLAHLEDCGTRSFHGSDLVHKKSMVYSMLREMGAQMKLPCRSMMG